MESVIDNLYFVRVYDAAEALIRDVVERYDIKSYDEFTCPYMKALAESLNFLDD